MAQSVALQNIQARTRMALACLFAQRLPSVTTFRGGKGGGSLLVLGSANVDEAEVTSQRRVISEQPFSIQATLTPKFFVV